MAILFSSPDDCRWPKIQFKKPQKMFFVSREFSRFVNFAFLRHFVIFFDHICCFLMIFLYIWRLCFCFCVLLTILDNLAVVYRIFLLFHLGNIEIYCDQANLVEYSINIVSLWICLIQKVRKCTVNI